MSRYRILYQTEDWWTLVVEAESKEDAYDKFMSGKYSHSAAQLSEGGYVQESIEIEEAFTK